MRGLGSLPDDLFREEERMTSAATWLGVSDEIARTAESVGKSVVALHSNSRAASGTLWQQNVIVTANHSARHDELRVLLPGGAFSSARVKGRDPSTDLAIFTMEAPAGEQATRGDAEQLRIGNYVLALGRTRRGNLTASSGIVSGLMGAWETWQGGHIDRFIRPDLALYRGFSGGPLVNAKGEVVGINTSGLRRGTPVTIPASTVTRVVEELLAKGHIARPHLGIALQPVSLPENLAAKLNSQSRFGLVIIHLENGSPAIDAGLMIGDIILEVAGKTVAQTPRLRGLLDHHKVGESVTLGIIRSGEKQEVSVTLGDRVEP
jgi:S1-C subfamily serine protease